jgi:Phage gp6-like head-tail connector protein
MADISVKVITPADSYDLATLDEVKVMLGIDPADTSEDALLQVWITQYSDMIATMCHRVFAYEEVEETWRGDTKPFDTDNGRVFLTHYPVADEDIVSVTGPDGADLSGTYELENRSGKLQFFNTPWSEPIRITYSGGYNLPEDAPPALKQALGLLVQIARAWQSRSLTAGVRSISHRESRVQFFDIFQELSKMGAPGPVGMASAMVQPLLTAYMRFYV